MPSTRRFPPPWTVEENRESFVIHDAIGQPLACVYFEDEPQRQMSMKRLSRDEARRIAANIAKLGGRPKDGLLPKKFPKFRCETDRLCRLLSARLDMSATRYPRREASHGKVHRASKH
jgi:hypothetical protein